MNLYIAIRNPWSHRPFRNLWCGIWTLGRHRSLEIQTYRYAWNLAEFDLELVWWGESHAGPKLEVNLLGWGIILSLPSNHHWDHEHHCWEKP
jgi:hypothetical protein